MASRVAWFRPYYLSGQRQKNDLNLATLISAKTRPHLSPANSDFF
jgi:hypothetical protein